MTQFVIRSMSATDFDIRTGQKSTRYHIYLMPAEKRAHAFWSSKGYAERFATEAAAYAAMISLKLDRAQIVPEDDQHLPPFWAAS